MSTYLKPIASQHGHVAASAVRGCRLTLDERFREDTTVVSYGFRDHGATGAVTTERLNVVAERPASASVIGAAGTHGAVVSTRHGNQLFGQQKSQFLTMWALRGLDPWSSAPT